jgi:hypothetical protein
MKWLAALLYYQSALVVFHHNLVVTFATKVSVAAGVLLELNLLQVKGK